MLKIWARKNYSFNKIFTKQNFVFYRLHRVYYNFRFSRREVLWSLRIIFSKYLNSYSRSFARKLSWILQLRHSGLKQGLRNCWSNPLSKETGFRVNSRVSCLCTTAPPWHNSTKGLVCSTHERTARIWI